MKLLSNPSTDGLHFYLNVLLWFNISNTHFTVEIFKSDFHGVDTKEDLLSPIQVTFNVSKFEAIAVLLREESYCIVEMVQLTKPIVELSS